MKTLHELNVHQLSYLCKHLVLDLKQLKDSTKVLDKRKWSYIISYPYFLDYFKKTDKIVNADLIIGGSFTYGWMPTTIVWKDQNFDTVVALLNKAKSRLAFLTKEELSTIKSLVNGSIVGTSKLLHFINPVDYPIWDSKIHKLIKNTEKRSSTNDVDVYLEYLTIFQKLRKHKLSKDIIDEISEKIGYKTSFARSFEMILFFSDVVTFEKSKAIKHIEGDFINKIPKYKRDEFIFISNLKKYTASDEYPIITDQ